MIAGVYRITLETGEVYIGISEDIYRRWAQHRDEIKRREHRNFRLLRAIDEYGNTATFEILEICPVEMLEAREAYWIRKLQPELNLRRNPYQRPLKVDAIALIQVIVEHCVFLEELPVTVKKNELSFWQYFDELKIPLRLLGAALYPSIREFRHDFKATLEYYFGLNLGKRPYETRDWWYLTLRCYIPKEISLRLPKPQPKRFPNEGV